VSITKLSNVYSKPSICAFSLLILTENKTYKYNLISTKVLMNFFNFQKLFVHVRTLYLVNKIELLFGITFNVQSEMKNTKYE